MLKSSWCSKAATRTDARFANGCAKRPAQEYLENLGQLWKEATLAEQTEITRLLVNAVFIDVGIHKIEAIEPKPMFRLLFEEVCEGIRVQLL